jgi:hypothetical protein
MSIELIAGFDTITQDSSLDWNPGSAYSPGTGRLGGYSAQGVYPANYTVLQKTLPSLPTRYCGFAFNVNVYETLPIVEFFDNATSQVQLTTSGIGQFQIYSGSTLVATTSPYFYRTDAWYYLEFGITIGSLGYYILRVGEQVILSGTAGTQQSTNSSTNVIQFTIQNSLFGRAQVIDDLYVLNALGSKNNTFLGEQKIITSDLNSDYSIQFSRNSGISNYGQLLTEDGDTTYTSSNVVGNKDLFGIVPLTITNNNHGQWYWGNDIVCTKAVIVARKDDVGYRNIGITVDSGSTESIFPFSVSSAGFSVYFIPLLTTYESSSVIMENDPNTNAVWTEAGVNAIKLGYQLLG